MATPAMVPRSQLLEWTGSDHGLRFCKNGHRMSNVDTFNAGDVICPICGAKEFATIQWPVGNDVMAPCPVPLNPIGHKRFWQAIEAYNKSGQRFVHAFQRVKIPIYDVTGIHGIWTRTTGRFNNGVTAIPDPFTTSAARGEAS